MFDEASSKLSAIYLAILMAISIFFSVNIYQASVAEFNRDFSRQQALLNDSNLLPQNTDARNAFLARRAQQYNEAKQRLLVRLAIVNGVIFVGAGFLSYYFARRTLEPIEKSHQALERFTADASHELRTPITAMQTEIEVALADPKLTIKEARQQLESNLEELATLTGLSNGLLQLARLDNEGPNIKRIELRKHVNKAIKHVGVMAKQRGTTISARIPAKQTVTADTTGLIEVLTILLDNAVKYSPDKSTVTVTSRAKGSSVLIEVSDNGPGIEKADLEHIFERFYRADKSRTHETTQSHGLGLSIAKTIIERQNGHITASSKVGSGSTFRIALPK